MPKDTYVTMYIDRALKTELQRLAGEQGHPNLTEFVCSELQERLDGLAPHGGRRKPPRRGPRGAHLTMWVDVELKEQLLRLADEDYRNLTDFVELQLREVVASAGEAAISAPVVAEQKRTSPRPVKTEVGRDRIAISINGELKVALEQLARTELRSLTNFIEFKLYQVAAAAGNARASSMPRRQMRDARLVMRVTPLFKAKLSKWAHEEYRTLTDLVEINLHGVAARYRKKKIR